MEDDKELMEGLKMLSKRVFLAHDRYLTCSDKELSINISTLFTFLSVNSNIVLTNYLDKRIGLMQLQQAQITYLLTGETEAWSYMRLQLSNFVREHTFKSRFFQWR